MILDYDFFLQVVGLFFAGIVQGVSGFALGLIAVAILVSFHSSVIVIPSLLIIYIITNFILIYEHHKIIDKNFLKNNYIFSPISLIIAILGLPLGSLILIHTNQRQINFLLGILITIISIYYLVQEFGLHRPSNFVYDNSKNLDGATLCYFSCFFSGLLEGFAGLGGPPIVIFMLAKNFDKHFFVASFSLFFLILSFFRLLIYLFIGLFNFEILKLLCYYCIFIFFGLYIGIHIRKKILDGYIFRRIVILILLLIGINLIIKQL